MYYQLPDLVSLCKRKGVAKVTAKGTHVIEDEDTQLERYVLSKLISPFSLPSPPKNPQTDPVSFRLLSFRSLLFLGYVDDPLFRCLCGFVNKLIFDSVFRLVGFFSGEGFLSALLDGCKGLFT